MTFESALLGNLESLEEVTANGIPFHDGVRLFHLNYDDNGQVIHCVFFTIHGKTHAMEFAGVELAYVTNHRGELQRTLDQIYTADGDYSEQLRAKCRELEEKHAKLTVLYSEAVAGETEMDELVRLRAKCLRLEQGEAIYRQQQESHTAYQQSWLAKLEESKAKCIRPEEELAQIHKGAQRVANERDTTKADISFLRYQLTTCEKQRDEARSERDKAQSYEDLMCKLKQEAEVERDTLREQLREAQDQRQHNAVVCDELMNKLEAAEKENHKHNCSPEAADTARLDWLDGQCEAYGFEGTHEGNRLMIDGPFVNLRVAIDDCRAAITAKERP